MTMLPLWPEFEPEPLGVDDALAETAEIMERAIAEHQPSRRFLLFSGGNDSLVVLDALASMADEIVHVSTGIGIPETDAFAERVARRYGLPYTVLSPETTTDAQGRRNEGYDAHVLNVARTGWWDGMPGPGAHTFTYNRLKQRPIEALLRHHRRFNGERFMLITGVRRAESKRRMGYAEPVNRSGGQVWVNPLLNWSNQNMRDYRQGESLPVNEVSVHLHMSGECLCGAMADQDDLRGEREQIRFFYPDFDRRLSGLEAKCRDRGLRYCEWGVKRPTAKADKSGPMCSSCEWRQGSFLDDEAAS